MARTQTLVCTPRRRRRRSRRSSRVLLISRANPAKKRKSARRNPARDPVVDVSIHARPDGSHVAHVLLRSGRHLTRSGSYQAVSQWVADKRHGVSGRGGQSARRNPARKSARRNPSSSGSTSATLVFRGRTSAGNPSEKGWVCEQSGTRVTFTWGKVGGWGKRLVKSFSSAALAADYARRSIKAKRDKGYVNGSPRFSSVTAAASRGGKSGGKKKASKKKSSASKAAPKKRSASKKRSGTGRKARRAARRQAARGGERRSAQIRRHAAALARDGGAGLGPADRPSLWGGWETAPISQAEYIAALARASKGKKRSASKGKRSSKTRRRGPDGRFLPSR